MVGVGARAVQDDREVGAMIMGSFTLAARPGAIRRVGATPLALRPSSRPGTIQPAGATRVWASIRAMAPHAGVTKPNTHSGRLSPHALQCLGAFFR